MLAYGQRVGLTDVIRLLATQWLSSLRHCAKRQKVADSISGGIIGVFH
jgi:hypothetical protein